ncbi:glycosyltransferase [Leuconostoc lactis]|uniref:glycosyltransferase n=1 Tax=Leuconostoc lactis TaxID=1246 RepID=UPI0028A00C55|nr:glycosyltransferase [Leuconostoc lactis]
MIFVTVGTHEQSFNRLIEAVDNLVRDNQIVEPVFMQIGYSTYLPKYTEYSKFLDFEKMNHMIESADVIVTHGGPASFLNAISSGKRPVVVPRQLKFNEHVNNHQIEFVEQIVQRNYPIDLVRNIDDLMPIINENKIKSGTFVSQSQNEKFIEMFSEVIKDIFNDSKKL